MSRSSREDECTRPRCVPRLLTGSTARYVVALRTRYCRWTWVSHQMSDDDRGGRRREEERDEPHCRLDAEETARASPAPFRALNSTSKICVLVATVGPKDSTRHRTCSCITALTCPLVHPAPSARRPSLHRTCQLPSIAKSAQSMVRVLACMHC